MQSPRLVKRWDDVGVPLYAGALSFSPDGRFLLVGGFQRDAATGASAGSVQVREVPGGKRARRFALDTFVTVVFWSPDRTTIGAAGASGVRLWNVTTGRPLPPLATPGFPLVRAAAVSPDGRVLATGGVESTTKRGQVRLWEVRTGKPVGAAFDAGGSQVWSVAFSPEKARGAAKALLALGVGKSSDGKWIDNFVCLWEPGSPSERLRLSRSRAEAQSQVAFSPDGKQIATGNGPEGEVLRWNVRTGKPLATLKGHTGAVYAVAFAPDGRLLATGSRDASVRLWRPDSGECVAVLRDPLTAVHAVAFSPDGRFLASGDIRHYVHLWALA